MKNTPLIWALVDGRPGNNSQILGVAEALEMPFVVKNIHYDRLGRIPNIIKGGSLLGLTAETKKELTPPWPDIVISIARKMESAALYIKKNSPKTKIVHIQRPDFPLRRFDLVACPAHDFLGRDKDRIPPNVLLTPGAPNRITSGVLESAREKWEPVFSKFPHPRIAVLVGGDIKRKKFTDAHTNDLVDKINALLKEAGGGSLLVTTSRRTPPNAIKILREKLAEPKYFYDSNDGGDNPYTGLLACADVMVPSGDSVSMCSEACTTGKPVYIYSPKGITQAKHRLCNRNLVAKGYALDLGDKWKMWSYTPLNDSKMVAEYIKQNYC